jgi:hypothetical protein
MSVAALSGKPDKASQVDFNRSKLKPCRTPYGQVGVDIAC